MSTTQLESTLMLLFCFSPEPSKSTRHGLMKVVLTVGLGLYIGAAIRWTTFLVLLTQKIFHPLAGPWLRGWRRMSCLVLKLRMTIDDCHVGAHLFQAFNKTFGKYVFSRQFIDTKIGENYSPDDT